MRSLSEFTGHTRDWVKRFNGDNRANVALIFAFASFGMAATAGIGLDMARAVSVRTQLATALDAAALAVGATTGLSHNELQAIAQRYFDANFPEGSVGTHGEVVVSGGAPKYNLSVTGTVPTTLLQIVNIDSFDLNVSNEVRRRTPKLRLSLVLDVTGSMAQSDATGTTKIAALKTATHNMLNLLEESAATDGDVQVAIVPFSLNVNVGTGNKNASWLDWTDYFAKPPNPTLPINQTSIGDAIGPGSSCPFTTSSQGFGCLHLSSGKIPSSGTYAGMICPGTDDGSPNSGRGGHIYNGCFNSVLKPGSSPARYTHTWVPAADKEGWGGCVMDRVQPNDGKNTTPAAGNVATLFSAENNTSCPPVSLLQLGYDWDDLNDKVDDLAPAGNTNQTIGLAWGWQALTQGNPLNAPAADPEAQDVIVLLSDGLNTQNRWSTSATSINARMTAACTNAKAANVRIFTLAVMTGYSSVLEKCATSKSNYYQLNSGGEINDAFTAIAGELANLHLSL